MLSFVVAFPLTKVNSSSRRQETNKKNESETMEGGACKMPFCVRTISPRRSLSCVPFVTVLEWESQLRWKNLVTLLRIHFHYLSTSINNKLKTQKTSQGRKYSGWGSKRSNMLLCDKYQRLHLLLSWKAHIFYIPDALFQYIAAVIQ